MARVATHGIDPLHRPEGRGFSVCRRSLPGRGPPAISGAGRLAPAGLRNRDGLRPRRCVRCPGQVVCAMGGIQRLPAKALWMAWKALRPCLRAESRIRAHRAHGEPGRRPVFRLVTAGDLQLGLHRPQGPFPALSGSSGRSSRGLCGRITARRAELEAAEKRRAKELEAVRAERGELACAAVVYIALGGPPGMSGLRLARRPEVNWASSCGAAPTASPAWSKPSSPSASPPQREVGKSSLSRFRVGFYDCLYTRADALFELTAQRGRSVIRLARCGLPVTAAARPGQTSRLPSAGYTNARARG